MFHKLFNKKFLPVGIVFTAFVAVAALLRLVLMVVTASHSQMQWWQYPVSFSMGVMYDVAVALFVCIPFVLYVWLQNDMMYQKKWKPFVIATFIIIIGLVLFTNIVPKEFNKLVYQLFVGYIIWRFALYVLLCFVTTKTRATIRIYLMYFMLLITFIIIIFNAISEWFFWEEFSTRYNFIAVDYLIYTNEVVGNIKESYPLGIIIPIIAAVAFAGVWLVRKLLQQWVHVCETITVRTVKALILLVLPALFYFVIQEKWHRYSNNEYANELAGNGLYQFGVAFKNNELDFYKFYKTMPDEAAFKIVREQLSDSNSTFTSNDVFNIERSIKGVGPEKKLNVVLISVESLSGAYMQHLGGTQNITPYLDSLVDKSMFFENLYASGTRTVRGLEALSLALPPVPGQSIVKRPDNDSLFTLGHVFKTKGYTTQYIYGGYSYFDNMQAFFGGNGYEVIDRSAIKPSGIHYQNIWGVADEDEFTLAIQTIDKNVAQQKPFFTHIMTVSNHRPFTYPDGRIDIPSASQTREGAVKYTDYCINKFIKEASGKPWFNNTVFVIVADHCAGSAGSVQLPVTGYHIPMLIYSPANIAPQRVSQLTAQIDIAPTLLGLLQFNYTSKFFGQDVLHTPANKRRAYISTYQGLGFIQNNQLIIQSPVKKIKQYQPDFTTGLATPQPLNDSLANVATAFYQTASWLIKNNKYHQ
ncbi:LTA synthase family protein [Ferruginibacter yonginensis]|uniref:LTA synthase family protein n=1 Tax=Ferruginibacter yonginensis TaxID=1310416 RepID=A0ABV8QN19_9BACT